MYYYKSKKKNISIITSITLFINKSLNFSLIIFILLFTSTYS